MIQVYGGETARWLWETQSTLFVDNVLRETLDLRRDPRKKETEKATKALQNWMGENPEVVENLMSFN